MDFCRKKENVLWSHSCHSESDHMLSSCLTPRWPWEWPRLWVLGSGWVRSRPLPSDWPSAVDWQSECSGSLSMSLCFLSMCTTCSDAVWSTADWFWRSGVEVLELLGRVFSLLRRRSSETDQSLSAAQTHGTTHTWPETLEQQQVRMEVWHHLQKSERALLPSVLIHTSNTSNHTEH